MPRSAREVRHRAPEPGREDREDRWRDWMAAAQRGDRACYEKLLTELLPVVRNLVRARTASHGSDAGVEDTVQDVLLSIHAARHTFRPERSLLPWVRAIVRNAVIDAGRREGRRRSRHADREPEELAAPPAAPPDAPLPSRLERALEALPAAQRQAVLLLKVEGLSVAEAAHRVGVSPGALKLRAHRGYRALRSILGSRTS